MKKLFRKNGIKKFTALSLILYERERDSAERERERNFKETKNEGIEEIAAGGGGMGGEAAAKGESLSRCGGRDGGSGFSPVHRPRSRQSLRRCGSLPRHWHFSSHLQAHQREDLCR